MRIDASCQTGATVAAALAWNSIDGPQLWADVECLPKGVASSVCLRAADELCQVRHIEKQVFARFCTRAKNVLNIHQTILYQTNERMSAHVRLRAACS